MVEYQEELKNREEEYDERYSELRRAGSHEAAQEYMAEFAQWRQDYRRMGEQLGYRQPGIAVSTNMWWVWGELAVVARGTAVAADGELRALGRNDESNPLGRSFQASLQAVTAAAFTIEGLYGHVCYYVPPQKGSARWVIVLNTLRTLFDLSGIAALQQKVEQLFALRDDGAHPWVALQPPVPHSSGLTNVSVEVAVYDAQTATESVSGALDILDHCSKRPLVGQRSAIRWARDHRALVEKLLATRRQ